MNDHSNVAAFEETKWCDGPTDIVVTPDKHDAALTFQPTPAHAEAGPNGCAEKDS